MIVPGAEMPSSTARSAAAAAGTSWSWADRSQRATSEMLIRLYIFKVKK